jgi:hypothetical protein
LELCAGGVNISKLCIARCRVGQNSAPDFSLMFRNISLPKFCQLCLRSTQPLADVDELISQGTEQAKSQGYSLATASGAGKKFSRHMRNHRLQKFDHDVFSCKFVHNAL